MRFITGFFIFFITCYIGLPALVDNPGILTTKAGWLVLAGVLATLFFVVVPSVNDLLYGRKIGWGDGNCPNCGGTGRAGYDLAKYGVKEECRACKGSGSGAGGPGGPPPPEEE